MLSAVEVERLRVAAGIPAVPADAGPGDLPLEGGLGEDAISATKGCSLGQEIIARLKSKGTIRRRLVRVRGADPVPAVPAALSRDGQPVGELRSAVEDGTGGFVGLALLKVAQAPSPAISTTAGGTRVRDTPPGQAPARLDCGSTTVEII